MSNSETPPAPESLPRHLLTTTRAAFFIAGVVLPCCAAIVSQLMNSAGKLMWRAGSTSQFLLLIADHRGILAFLPLLGYSTVSLILMLDDFKRWSRVFHVRLGIYGGVLLAVQKLVASVVILGGSHSEDLAKPTVIFVLTLGLPITLLWSIITPSRDVSLGNRRQRIVEFLAMLLGIGATLAIAAHLELPISAAFLTMAHCLELTAYADMSIRVFPRGEPLSRFSLQRLLVSIGWLSVYFAAVRWAVHVALARHAH